MAKMGVRSLNDLIGQTDMLDTDEAIAHWKAKGLDFSKLFAKIDSQGEAVYRSQNQEHPIVDILDRKLIAEAKDALDKALKQFERAPFVKQQLLALGGELGLADAKEAGGSDTVSAPRGPTAEQMRDALNMSAEDRQEMIEGMVAGLAAKLEENPNDLQGWIRLARSYNVLQKPEEARDAMARAAKVAPENVDILTLYARTIRTAAGNQPTAASAQIMQRILTLDPDNVEALFFTGLAANGAGDKEEARRLWEKAKSGLPENSPQRAAVQRQMDSLGK